MSKILTPEEIAAEKADGHTLMDWLCDSHEALRAELEQAQAQASVLRDALEAICNPIKWLDDHGRPDKKDRNWLAHLIDNALTTIQNMAEEREA